MPIEWRGTWFEAGIGDVTITDRAVLNKGECVLNANDYYLLDNRQFDMAFTAYEHKKLSYRRGTARCVVSVEILPTATQQCRNYLYDKS